MRLFGYPVVISNEFPKDIDEPFILLGSLNDYTIPLSLDDIEKLLLESDNGIELPDERLEIALNKKVFTE